MTKKLKQLIGDVCGRYAFDQNTKENRELLVRDLNSIPWNKYEFEDKTTIEMVSENNTFFVGLNPKTKKVIHLTINPTRINLF